MNMKAALQVSLICFDVIANIAADAEKKVAVQKFRPELSGELVEAARSGLTDRVLQLLHKGADPNAADPTEGSKETTALMSAVLSGNQQIVAARIKAGADVNGTDYVKATPLMMAAMKGNDDLASALIDAGA